MKSGPEKISAFSDYKLARSESSFLIRIIFVPICSNMSTHVLLALVKLHESVYIISDSSTLAFRIALPNISASYENFCRLIIHSVTDLFEKNVRRPRREGLKSILGFLFFLVWLFVRM